MIRQTIANLTHKELSFSSGESIFELGDIGNVLYVVLEGQIEIIVHDKVMDTVEPGGILGEMALIDARPRSATAIAQGNCKVVPIDRDAFKTLIQQQPEFALEVMRVMVERLRYMNSVV